MHALHTGATVLVRQSPHTCMQQVPEPEEEQQAHTIRRRATVICRRADCLTAKAQNMKTVQTDVLDNAKDTRHLHQHVKRASGVCQQRCRWHQHQRNHAATFQNHAPCHVRSHTPQAAGSPGHWHQAGTPSSLSQPAGGNKNGPRQIKASFLKPKVDSTGKAA